MSSGKHHIEEELLIRFIVGETSNEESDIVMNWISLSDENRTTYETLQKTWSLVENPSKIHPADVDTNVAWQNLKNRIDQYAEIEARHKPGQHSIFYYALRVAAIFIVGLLIFSIYRYQSNWAQQVQLVSNDSTITNNPLPDGTIISLNQQTIIEYPEHFSQNERKIKLDGEAFFKVKRDETKPFIIEAQKAIITVLGTSFNVKALEADEAVEVLVEEGLVKLENPDLTQSTLLSVGEKGIYIKKTNEVKKETDIDVESLYWLNKTLLFRNTKLSVVFETLERLYDIKINAENPAILNCKLTAKFSNESIDHIIDHISTIFELESKKEDKLFILKGNGCQ